MCEIDRRLGTWIFATTFSCETAEYKALWGRQYYGTFDRPGL